MSVDQLAKPIRTARDAAAPFTVKSVSDGLGDRSTEQRFARRGPDVLVVGDTDFDIRLARIRRSRPRSAGAVPGLVGQD